MVSGGKASHRRGEPFGSPAGIGDGASARDFESAFVCVAQGVSGGTAWHDRRICAGGGGGRAARKGAGTWRWAGSDLGRERAGCFGRLRGRGGGAAAGPWA